MIKKFFNYKLTVWEWILGNLIVSILWSVLSGCSTARQMQKETHQVKVDCTALETQTTQKDVVSKLTRELSSTTETTETIDTLIRVLDPKTGVTLTVPVHEKKVTKRQEYLATEENTQDNSRISVAKNTQENKAVINQSKQVITKRPNLTLYIVIAASVLIVLLFVFLWRRFPLARLLDIFKR
jgi:hypothetical protein